MCMTSHHQPSLRSKHLGALHASISASVALAAHSLLPLGHRASAKVAARIITFLCSPSRVEIPSLGSFHHVRVVLRVH